MGIDVVGRPNRTIGGMLKGSYGRGDIRARIDRIMGKNPMDICAAVQRLEGRPLSGVVFLFANMRTDKDSRGRYRYHSELAEALIMAPWHDEDFRAQIIAHPRISTESLATMSIDLMGECVPSRDAWTSSVARLFSNPFMPAGKTAQVLTEMAKTNDFVAAHSIYHGLEQAWGWRSPKFNEMGALIPEGFRGRIANTTDPSALLDGCCV